MKKFISILCVIIIVTAIFTSNSYASSDKNSIFIEKEFVIDNIDSYSRSVVKIMVYHVKDDKTIDYINKGSGFYIDNNLIVTAAHYFIDNDGMVMTDVIRYSYAIYSRGFSARIVSIDIENDICILAPTSNDFMRAKTLDIDYEAKVSTDEQCYTVGYPDGEFSLINVKYEYNKEISVEVFKNAIHQDSAYCFSTDVNVDDASKTQGLSGGPIINSNGKAVAIEGYSDKSHVYGINLEVLKIMVDRYNDIKDEV
ncbi:MAG: serine protease [Clostridia bacterium]